MDFKLIKNAADQGLPALTDLFKNLSKEDALKGIGIMVIMGVAYKTIDVIKDIVLGKS